MNGGGDCRTAPAIPGLLNMCTVQPVTVTLTTAQVPDFLNVINRPGVAGAVL